MGTVAITLPVGTQDRSTPITVKVTFTANRANEYWVGYWDNSGTPVVKNFALKLKYRVVGAGSWTFLRGSSETPGTTGSDFYAPSNADMLSTNTVTTPNQYSYTFGINALSAGNYEFAAYIATYTPGRTPDPSENIGWSATAGPMVVAAPPNTPTITAPTAGQDINTGFNVTWTQASAGTHAQVRVMNGAIVEWDTGAYAITTAFGQNKIITLPTNSVSRDIQVRYKESGTGTWSAWATVNIDVVWQEPIASSFGAIVANDAAGVGFAHALSFTLNHSANGGNPAINRAEVFARPVGDTSEGIRVINIPAISNTTQPLKWWGPASGVAYQLKVRVWSVTGTYKDSSWVSQTGPTVAIKGAMFHSRGQGTLPIAQDLFNAGDSTTAVWDGPSGPGRNTTQGDLTWQGGTPDWGVLSQKAYKPVAGFDICTLDPGDPNVWVECSYTVGAALGDNGLVVRYTDANNHIRILSASGGQWVVRKVVGGSATNIITAGTVAVSTTYTLRVETYGASLFFYVGGVLVGSTTLTDAILLTGTRVGMITVTGTDNFWDTYTVGIMAAAADPVNIRANFDGVKEMRSVESATLRYAGREYPVVEYGQGGDRVYTLDRLADEYGEIDALRNLVDKRETLCYQDKRGRVLYGLVSLGEIEDGGGGYKACSLSIIQTYGDDERPSDAT